MELVILSRVYKNIPIIFCDTLFGVPLWNLHIVLQYNSATSIDQQMKRHLKTQLQFQSIVQTGGSIYIYVKFIMRLKAD